MLDAESETQSTPDVDRELTSSGKKSIAAIALMVFLQLPIAAHLISGDGITAQIGREAVYWGFTVVLISYIHFVERRPLTSVRLFKPTWKSLLYGIAAGAIMIAGMALIYLFVFPLLGVSPVESGMTAVKAQPIWFRLLLVLRAGVFEELYFRGFMIERLTEIFGVRWIAAGISLAAFTFAHLAYWGWPHLIIAGFGGAVLTGLYLLRCDLSCNIFAHLLTDAVGFLVG